MQVICRLRPTQTPITCVLPGPQNSVYLSQTPINKQKPPPLSLPKLYFDGIVLQQQEQAALFENWVSENLDQLLNGRDFQCIVFGQSHSGKSFTMRGGQGLKRGIVLRSAQKLLSLSLRLKLRLRLTVSVTAVTQNQLISLLNRQQIEIFKISDLHSCLHLALKNRTRLGPASIKQVIHLVITFRLFEANELLAKADFVELASSDFVGKQASLSRDFKELSKNLRGSLTAQSTLVQSFNFQTGARILFVCCLYPVVQKYLESWIALNYSHKIWRHCQREQIKRPRRSPSWTGKTPNKLSRTPSALVKTPVIKTPIPQAKTPNPTAKTPQNTPPEKTPVKELVKIQELAQQVKFLKSQKFIVEKELEELRSINQEHIKALEEKEQTVSQLKSQLNSQNLMVFNMQNEKSDLITKVEELKTNVDFITDQKNRCQKQQRTLLKKKEKQLKNSQLQIEKLRQFIQSKEQEATNMTSEWNLTYLTLVDQLSSLAKQNENTQLQNKYLQQTSCIARNWRIQAQAIINQLAEDVKSLLDPVLPQHTLELVQKFQMLRQQTGVKSQLEIPKQSKISCIVEKLSCLDQMLRQSELSFKIDQAPKRSVQRELQRRNQAIRNLTSEVSSLQTQIQVLTSLVTDSQNIIHQLKKNLNLQSKDLQQAYYQKQQLSNDVEKAKKLVNFYQKQDKSLSERHLNIIKQETSHDEIYCLEVEKLKLELTHLRLDKNQLQIENNQLQEEVEHCFKLISPRIESVGRLIDSLLNFNNSDPLVYSVVRV